MVTWLKSAVVAASVRRQSVGRDQLQIEWVVTCSNFYWVVHWLARLQARTETGTEAEHMDSRQRKLVRAVIKRVHPDLFPDYPLEQLANSEALKAC